MKGIERRGIGGLNYPHTEYHKYCDIVEFKTIEGDAKNRTDVATRKETFNPKKHLKFFVKEGKTLVEGLIQCVIEDAKTIFDVSRKNDLRQFLIEIGLHNVYDVMAVPRYYRKCMVYYLTKRENLPSLPLWRRYADFIAVPEDVSKLEVDEESFLEKPPVKISYWDDTYTKKGKKKVRKKDTRPRVNINKYIKSIVKWTGRCEREVRDKMSLTLYANGEAGVREWYNKEKEEAFSKGEILQ